MLNIFTPLVGVSPATKASLPWSGGLADQFHLAQVSFSCPSLVTVNDSSIAH